MGKSSRDKGKRGERAVADLFRQVAPEGIEVRRGRQAEGAAEADIVLPLLWVEVKRGGPARYPLKALMQAVADSIGSGLSPAVAFRQDRQPWRALMRRGDWLTLVGSVHAAHRMTAHGMAQSTLTMPLEALVCDWATALGRPF